jgi:hypothetical protein
VPIDSPMRELIFELTRLFELAAGCLTPVEGFALCLLIMPLLLELDLLVTLVVSCLVFTELDRTVLFEIEVRLFELVLGLNVTVRLEEVLVLLRFTIVLFG